MIRAREVSTPSWRSHWSYAARKWPGGGLINVLICGVQDSNSSKYSLINQQEFVCLQVGNKQKCAQLCQAYQCGSTGHTAQCIGYTSALTLDCLVTTYIEHTQTAHLIVAGVDGIWTFHPLTCSPPTSGRLVAR